METNQVLEERIAEWRRYTRRRQAIHGVDLEELEDRLRTEVKILCAAGLHDDEAFLVAVKRLGDLDSLSREFASKYSERLWKQLVVSPGSIQVSSEANLEVMVAVGLAIGAAVTIKLPELFGLSISGPDGAVELVSSAWL